MKWVHWNAYQKQLCGHPGPNAWEDDGPGPHHISLRDFFFFKIEIGQLMVGGIFQKKHTYRHPHFVVFFVCFSLFSVNSLIYSSFVSGNHQKPEALHFDRWQDARIQTFDHHCHRHRRHDTSSDHPQGFCPAAKMMVMMMMMMMMILTVI